MKLPLVRANASTSAQQAADNLQELKDGIASGTSKAEKGDRGEKGDTGETGPAPLSRSAL